MKRFLCLILAIFCLSGNIIASYANGLEDFQFGLDVEEGKKEVSIVVKTSENIDNASAWGKIYDRYKTVINFIYIVMTLTCLAGLIFSIVKLGSSGGNPQMRQQAIMGILFCGIGVALLGSVGIWFGFAMNIL